MGAFDDLIPQGGGFSDLIPRKDSKQGMISNATHAQSTNPIAALTGYAANAMQAIPFSDEAGSAIAATFGAGEGEKWGERYKNLQQSQQAMREAGSKLYPTATAIGQGGSALMTIPMLPQAKMAEGANLVGKMGRAFVQNAPYGIAYGLGEQDEFSPESGIDQRLENAATLGGATGAIGSAIPLAGSALRATGKVGSALGQGVQKLFQSKQTGEDIASKQMAELLRRSNTDVANLPLDKNLLQEGGRPAISRAEAIATRESPASDSLMGYIKDRATALPSELSGYLGKKFEESNFPVLLEQLKKKTYETAKPAYEAAYNAVTKINDPQINEALDRIVSADDWGVLTKEARKLAALDGQKLGNLDATGKIRSFSTQDLDYMTRAYRNLGQATEGLGAMGSKTPIGGKRAAVAGGIRSRLGELNPAFKDAVTQFSDDVGIYEAAEAGKAANLMGGNWKSALHEYSQLTSDAARKAWQLGQAENLQLMINRNPSAALRQFNSPQFKKAMSAFYEGPEYEQLITNLTSRAQEAAGLQRVSGNSRTAARALQQADDVAMNQGNGLGELAGEVMQSGAKRTALNRMAEFLSQKLTNTPEMQQADKLMVEALTRKPYALAAGETTGELPAKLMAAMLKDGAPIKKTAPSKLAKFLRQVESNSSLAGKATAIMGSE